MRALGDVDLPIPADSQHWRLELKAPLVAGVVLEDAHLRTSAGLDDRRRLSANSSSHILVVRVDVFSSRGERLIIAVQVTTCLCSRGQ